MALTPVEIRHLSFGRRLLGYRRAAVDGCLGDIADSFEDVWRDRADLADKVEHLEGELVRFKELEALLRATLVSAERSAQELRDQAKREADLVLAEAHAEAREVTRRAHAEHARLVRETRRLKALLRAALDAVDADGAPEEEPGEPAPGGWDADDDTGQWGAAA